MKYRRFLSVALSCVMMLATISMPKQLLNQQLITNTASAASIIDKGKCGSEASYSLDGAGTLTISGYGDMYENGSEGIVVWHKYRKDIKTIIIEDGITNISEFSFSNCPNLISVTIPNSVKSIGKYAFFNSTSLESITIPDSINKIGYGAFLDCTNLESIHIPTNVLDFGGYVFWRTKWNELQLQSSPFVIINGVLVDGHSCSGDIEIPDTVKIISEYAFYQCNDITSVTIPVTVNKVCDKAFAYCKNLKKVVFLNPTCEISGEWDTICTERTTYSYLFYGDIFGYKGSYAQSYAEQTQKPFTAFSDVPRIKNCVCSKEYVGTYTTKNVANALNIRAEHNLDSSSLGTIPADADMEYIQRVSEQTTVSTPNADIITTSTCSCSDANAGEYILKDTNALDIKASHNVDSDVVGLVYKNVKFSITKADDDWAHFEYDGLTGYVKKGFIQPYIEC